MTGGLTIPPWLPHPLRRAYWLALDAAGYLLVARHLNRLRAGLGLPPVRRVFRWWLSPDLVFAVYFPQVEELALSDSLFGDTFLGCRPFGQSAEAAVASCYPACGRWGASRYLELNGTPAPQRRRAVAFRGGVTMHEAILRDFFLGNTDAARLQADLEGGVRQSGITREHQIADMDTELVVESAHLVRLCDAVLAGEFRPEALQQIGFCLIASVRFHWDADTPDGSVVAEVVADWSCPEINWPLIPENVYRFRQGLVAGSYPFRSGQPPNESLQPTGAAILVSQDIKVPNSNPGS
jgi:hypothetical protein